MQIEILTKDLKYKSGTTNVVGRLPGMNDIIAVSKKGKGAYQPYSLMKKYYQDILRGYFNKLPGYEVIKITIDWYEPNQRRDVDNITAGTKFIMDSLVQTSVIKDDSQRYVKSITHNIFVDKENPRIIVNIEEV